jgi:hypothetical protein
MVYTRIVQPGARHRYSYTPGERTIFRVSGTILPEVWRMMVLTSALTLVICHCYDPLRRAEKKSVAMGSREELVLHLFRDMEHVLTYFTGFLTFILGFFNSIVFARWWKMRELCGEIIKQSQALAMQVTALVQPNDPDDEALCAEATRARREMIRLVVLGQALALQACHRVRDLNWLIEQGLLVRDSREVVALEKIEGPRYKEVFGWCFAAARKVHTNPGLLPPANTFMYVVGVKLELSMSAAEDLMMHINQQVRTCLLMLLCSSLSVMRAFTQPSGGPLNTTITRASCS